MRKIAPIFVAFSEKLNFNLRWNKLIKYWKIIKAEIMQNTVLIMNEL